MKCARCKGEITGECHSMGYDEPPFFCSETCYGNHGLFYDLYWMFIKWVKSKHWFKCLETYG